MDPKKPTDLQLQLAEQLGIENAAGMSKAELLRTFAKMHDPAFDDYEGDALVALDNAKVAIDPGYQYALTLYQRGQKYIVDVLHFEGLHSDDKDRIYFECTVPVIDRTDGPDYYTPEWYDKTIDLTIDKIVFYRELPADFADRCQSSFNMDYYRQTVAWGVEQALTTMGIEADVNPIAKAPKPSTNAPKPSGRQQVSAKNEASGFGCLVLLTLILSLAFAVASGI